MSRRSRNSRAWRYVWGGIRRDADARALVLASESEEWTYDRLEVRIQCQCMCKVLCHMMHCRQEMGCVTVYRGLAKCTSGIHVKLKVFSLPEAIIQSVFVNVLSVQLFGCFVSELIIFHRKECILMLCF